jgi:hypothetical protein
MATIADMTGLKRKNIPRTISRLEYLQLFTHEPSGPNGTNIYKLSLGAEVSSTMRTGVLNGEDRGCPQHRGQGVLNVEPKVSSPVRTKQTKEQTKEHTGASDGEIADPFETFWRVYPSRKPHDNPKKPARLKFEAALRRGVDPFSMIQGAENYAGYTRAHIRSPEFIKTAEVWLNKECWIEYQQPLEPEPLRAGMI